MVDANFDGWPDLSVPGYSGGAGPNATRNLYLFDPAAGLRVRANAVGPAAAGHRPRHAHPHVCLARGCCSHATETYRYVDGQLQQVASWEESLSPDGEHLQTTEGTLRNGKMTYRTRTRTLPADWR